MTAFEYVMIFVVAWWVGLFAVLPFSVKRTEVSDGPEYHAAPEKVYLARILLVTTVLAVIVTVLVSWLIQHDVFSAWQVSSSS